MVAVLVLALMSFGAAPLASAQGGEAAELERLIAAVRRNAGVRPLTADPALTQEAQRWADTMAANGRLEHSPNLGRLLALNFDRAGENVGYSQVSVAAVVAGFEASAVHRVNDQDPGWTSIGVGVAAAEGDGGGREWYVAVLYGMRSVPRPARRARPAAAGTPSTTSTTSASIPAPATRTS